MAPSTVTDYFGLVKPVPFVDVYVELDNRIFIDPSCIRNGTDKYSHLAQAKLTAYFDLVVKAARSSSPANRIYGRSLLDHTHEPNETRLGMSKKEPRGAGFADGLADELWSELVKNPACQSAALTRLEHVPLFIEFVGPDRISDLTTRIIFDVLAEFTRDMMGTYPSLKAGMTTQTSFWWSPVSGDWQQGKFTLPFAGKHQLLLVPTQWVFWRNVMYPNQFYNRFTTQMIALERGRRNKKGKIVPASKAEIKEEFPHIRDLNNAKTVEYLTEYDRNLALEYQQAVDAKFKPLSQAQIRDRIKRGM